MFPELQGSDVIELSLFIRAVFYAILFTGVGIEALRYQEKLSTFAVGLAWVSIVVGCFNILMAVEWLLLLLIREVPILS